MGAAVGAGAGGVAAGVAEAQREGGRGMNAAGKVGVAVGGWVVLDLAVMPALDVWGHMVRSFPSLTAWGMAANATLQGRGWPVEAIHLAAVHPTWWDAAQIPWVIGAAMVGWWVAWGARRAGEPRAAASATHGSARWRRPTELRETLRLVDCGKPDAAGAVVGGDGKHAWVTKPEGVGAGNPHVLLLGTPGTGKSRGVILPTIWTLGHAGDSMIVSDPKGELYQASAAFLRGRGYEVRLVDLAEPRRGNRWNPLAVVRGAFEAGDVGRAATRAKELANTFAVAAGGGPSGEGGQKSDFWDRAGRALLTALTLGIAGEAPADQANPASIHRTLLDLGGEANGVLLDGWFHMLEGRDPARPHPAAAAYAQTRLSGPAAQARGSILMTAAGQLDLFADPSIAWLTAESDHDPMDAAEKPVATFICVPDESPVTHPLLSLYVAQAYIGFVQLARDLPGGALKRPVWFLLDEFGNIGKLADIGGKVSAARQRRIRFLFVLQNLEQLEVLYGRAEAATVVGNCDTLIYLSTNSNTTAKTISDRIGSYTVKTTSLSTKPALGASVSGTESGTGRPLLAPDEVMRLRPGQALVLQARHHAARLPLADLSRWDGAAGALVPAGLPAPKPAEPVAGWVPDPDEIMAFLARQKQEREARAERAVDAAGGGAPGEDPLGEEPEDPDEPPEAGEPAPAPPSGPQGGGGRWGSRGAQ